MLSLSLCVGALYSCMQLSALISGVVTRLQNMGNMAVTWLPMILNQGILVVWESLLSTHGTFNMLLTIAAIS